MSTVITEVGYSHAKMGHMSKKVRRLYEQFKPTSYKLTLDINPEAMTFIGNVVIAGKKTGRPSQRLTFHASGLDVTAASIISEDKKGAQSHEVERINTQKTYEEVRLHTADLLFPGNYTISMRFEGVITRPMEGMYPCFFKRDGKEKKLIATQFESHHAREVFPSIDEPEAKAVFDLTLVTPEGQTVVSNTPVESQEDTNGRTTTVFGTTPKMSTYLLAFAFGDMGFLEAKTKDGVLVRTYATPDNVQYTQFALDVAVKCLEFYNEYFDIPYPLAKCDFLALPDFASGAMENWGCITFREQALLVDPKNTSLPMKQYVAMVVAHELTHQWFGNLVTMRWWNDLWLNESFATWMSYLAEDKLFPEWNVWTQFIVDEQHQAMKLDALEHTHPIEVTINHPDEIRTIFDAISYEKGASVLQMLHGYIGPDNFRDGLRQYLKQHSYGNTATTDLWQALENASKQPVTSFMHAWTSQPGFPLLNAEVKNSEIKLTQKRFCVNPKAHVPTETWPIPLLPKDAKLSAAVADNATETVQIEKTTGNVILNSGRNAFYRVTYDSAHLAKLAADVKASKLEPLDRLGLLSDVFEAAKSGATSTVDALKLLEAYRDEDNTVVWDIIAGNLGGIRAVMDDEALREAMKPYVRDLTAKQLARLGWEEKPNDSHFDKLLRPTILGLSSWAEEPEVVSEANRQFKAMSRPEDVEPDLRGIVYGTAARTGGKVEFEKMLKMHNETPSSEERVTLAAAMTGFEQPELIKKALSFIDTNTVRLQDAGYWVAYSFMNRHAKRLTWDWMIAHWEWLDQNMGKDLSFYRMPNYAARAFSDATFLPEYKKFFLSHMTAAFERPVNQGIETIEWQSAWRDRDLKDLKAYFKA
jgi:aminopeptidase N